MDTRIVLAAVIAAAVTAARADDPAPASTPASKPPARSAPAGDQTGSKKKLGSLKEFGNELGKLGSTIGQGTVKTGKSIGNKVSSDVKNKNFKPNKEAQPPAPNPRDRSGTP